MAIFSGSSAVSMAGVTYWRGVDPALKSSYSGGAILVLVAVLVFGNIMIATAQQQAPSRDAPEAIRDPPSAPSGDRKGQAPLTG